MSNWNPLSVFNLSTFPFIFFFISSNIWNPPFLSSPSLSRSLSLSIYINIYIYVYISGDSCLFLLHVPPPTPSVNFSSQPVVHGPKVNHHSCYCVILHCIAQIDKCILHGVFFCKQSRYNIICSLVNTVDKIIFFLSKV